MDNHGCGNQADRSLTVATCRRTVAGTAPHVNAGRPGLQGGRAVPFRPHFPLRFSYDSFGTRLATPPGSGASVLARDWVRLPADERSHRALFYCSQRVATAFWVRPRPIFHRAVPLAWHFEPPDPQWAGLVSVIALGIASPSMSRPGATRNWVRFAPKKPKLSDVTPFKPKG